MRTEVVAIGTELLLGQITDTNSSWIGEQLAVSGIDTFFQTKVGDNQDRIVATLSLALDRSDAVICCGGLGPTQDDLTREAIAAVMGVALEPDEAMEERIIELFSGRGRRMPMNNLRQALRPAGAEFIAQMPGTAPGLVCPLAWPDGAGGTTDKVIYAVPGVPWEMKEMVLGTILPDLQRRAGITSVIASRTLRTWGESESGLAEILAPRIDELDQGGAATLAFLASGMEGLKVRITAKAPAEAEAQQVLDDEERLLRELLGPIVFGVDDDTMESVVLGLLRERGLTLGVAESVTGGLVSGRITAVPGASQAYRGCIVSYASEVKFDLLGVPEGPVVNEPTAAAMAEGVCRVLGSDVGLALTGVAGPAEQDGMPVGTLCVGVSLPDPGAAAPGGRRTLTRTLRLPGQRDQMRQMSVISALDLLRRELLAGPGAAPHQ
jgi:nicotinamide-nucleotide amidase